MTIFYRAAYHGLIALGRPIGGVRPRRVYDLLGRKAYPAPTPARWTRNRWGHELLLSHHFHLDRNILIYGDYDHDLHRLLESRIKPGMTVLDVGANLGEMTLHMGSLVGGGEGGGGGGEEGGGGGGGGGVHAFEPFPPAFQRLVTHVERNGMQGRIHPWPIALSNEAGAITMSVPAADADNQGVGSIIPQPGAAQNVSVQAITLDDFVEKQSITKIDFIKLDIQGAEYLFLEGAANTVRTHRPDIVMEVSPDDLRRLKKNSRDLLARVESLGYRVFGVHKGRPAAAIAASSVPLDFAATNVLCLPR